MKLSELKPEEKRILAAEACGWSLRRNVLELRYGKAKDVCDISWLPDYGNDLNACVEMEATLTEKLDQNAYSEALFQIINREKDGEFRFIGATPFHYATATAAQRLDAFILAKGLAE